MKLKCIFTFTQNKAVWIYIFLSELIIFLIQMMILVLISCPMKMIYSKIRITWQYLMISSSSIRLLLLFLFLFQEVITTIIKVFISLKLSLFIFWHDVDVLHKELFVWMCNGSVGLKIESKIKNRKKYRIWL